MDDEQEPLYLVVVNDEEQYSIWLATQPVPAGWYPVGDPEPKAQCLDRINELWVDLRPKSARRD